MNEEKKETSGYIYIFIGIIILIGVYYMYSNSKNREIIEDIKLGLNDTYLMDSGNCIGEILDYENSDYGVASVDENGKIYALKEGVTRILSRNSHGDVCIIYNVDIFEKEKNKILISKLDIADNFVVKIGEIKEIDYSFSPLDADEKPMFASNDESLLVITNDGKMKGLKSGNTTITVTTKGGLITKIIDVVITSNEEKPQSDNKQDPTKIENNEKPIIKFTQTSISLDKGTTYTLEYSIDNINESDVEWEVNYPNIVTINNGIVKALSKGEAIVTLKYENKVSASITIYVKDANEITMIIMPKDKVNLKVGQEYKVEPIISPDTVKNASLIWSSSNSEIVTIDNGVIKAKSPGYSKVSVKSNNNITAYIDINVIREVIEPESILLNKTNLDLYIGSDELLAYSIMPVETTENKITWTSTNEKVVTVINGKIKAIGIGNASIIVKTSNGKSNTCNVNVKPIPVNSVTLNNHTLTLGITQTAKLTAAVLPINATNKEITWSSSNPNVATVDSSGNITAKKIGNAVITVKTSNNKTEQCTIIVSSIDVKNVKLNTNAISLYIGQDYTLIATILPTNATNKTIKWTSSDERIVKVIDGKIIGKRSGSSIITATSSNGLSASCKVTFISKLKGKTAIFFGDSITYGSRGTPVGYSWANYIGDRYDLSKAVNAGKPGWFVSNLDAHFITSEVKNHAKEQYDYVILHGGTNDVSRLVPIGTYDKTDFSGNYNDKTLLGGLETYIYTAKKQWPNAKIGYIINYETPNRGENRPLYSAEYYTAMKKVLDKWKIKYLDLFFGNFYGLKYSDILKVNTKQYLVDNLHLNNDGYILVTPFIYIWMNTL